MISGIFDPEELNVLAGKTAVFSSSNLMLFDATSELSVRINRSVSATLAALIASNPVNFMVIFCCL
jgi:hypothetical protein